MCNNNTLQRMTTMVSVYKTYTSRIFYRENLETRRCSFCNSIISTIIATSSYLTSQKVLMGASGFQSSTFSGRCSTSSASMASCATSGMVCWCTSDTRPLISSSVELWISWPALPGFCSSQSQSSQHLVGSRYCCQSSHGSHVIAR